jgi:hypothetical protein
LFNYLATLRLNRGALMVGPKRRVVFSSGMRQKKLDGSEVTRNDLKAALRPLSGYWSKPSEEGHRPGAPVQKDVPVMSAYEFRLRAKRLLMNAGLLRPTLAED